VQENSEHPLPARGSCKKITLRNASERKKTALSRRIDEAVSHRPLLERIADERQSAFRNSSSVTASPLHCGWRDPNRPNSIAITSVFCSDW